ncbi:MAG: surface antigen [Candidatus Sulfotelmatobacter sp.]|nr:surface antigen [Candidatus Sulfotelmatobacter sp.]
MLRRYASLVILIIGSLGPAARTGSAADAFPHRPQEQAAQPSSALTSMAAYAGRIVESIELPGVAHPEHLLQMLAQKAGEPLSREKVRESIRVLFATGRFSDIQAEVRESGSGVVLVFATSLNFFVGAVDIEGAPSHPNYNQIVNASKLQLGEPHTRDKLDRAVQNVRQLMQENGYYRARVTAESTSNAATQQVDILFHITPGEPAHVGEVNATGHSTFSQQQLQDIAKMHPGDRVTATRVTNSLQRLRKKFQKQHRVLAQVSIAEQKYNPSSNAISYTYLIEPGPVVVIFAQGFHISRAALKREIPVYEENALDDDLLNEGQRNLLDYLQSRGHFDAAVEFHKETAPDTLRVIYRIDPGAVHRFELIDITGNKYFSRQMLRPRLHIQPAGHFSSRGRYSGALLKSDVAALQALYVSNGFRQVRIQTKVDDNYNGAVNHLAVHIQIEEGPQTLVGTFQIVGNQKINAKEFPELRTTTGQPYSEQNLASDRESVLSYYFNHGFSNATLDITTKPSPRQSNREDVTYTIQEGEQFFVSQVRVGGLDHTRDYVVQREIQVAEGEPLSQQDLLDTQSKLYDLGIFSQVDTAVQNPEGADPQKTVLIQAQEARRYTFTYGVGLEFETGLPSGTNSPAGSTGVSPRVEFDVTRLNMGGRNQTLIFQSHVGRLQQRGLVSYEIPKLFNNGHLKLFYTIFYDNSLDVATFTSQRLEGKIDLRQQIGQERPNSSTSVTYRFDYRRVKASNFAADFSPAQFSLFSLPAVVGGPGITFIRDQRDNPLESTKGQYFTFDGFAASSYVGSQADFGRALAQDSTYYAFGRANHKFVFARSTSLGLEQVYRGTRVLPPGACQVTNLTTSCGQDITVIPLPELFFAGGGNSHRGFGLNQAGPRDPDSGFPVGGSALFVNSEELRFPSVSLPFLGEGFGFAIFHDMGNVFTAGHDMLKGVLRWHQPNPSQCLQFSPVTTATQYNDCVTHFNNSGYDYTSHAVGVGLRYKTPIGPLRFDFGYNLNPTEYPTGYTLSATQPFIPQRLRHFNVFFSIGQPF